MSSITPKTITAVIKVRVSVKNGGMLLRVEEASSGNIAPINMEPKVG